MTSTPPHRTARRRARAEITRAITDEARRQLALVGTQGLSLRAVARELGMVSSALYRYFPSRDELLTALIVDAYNGLGAAAEAAGEAGDTARGRWVATCHAVRDWARAHPHEYTLIYGSPIPGYHAPRDTVPPAARVPRTLVRVLETGLDRDEITVPEDDVPDPLHSQLDTITAALGSPEGTALPKPLLTRGLVAWTQLFGMVGFELTGQFANSLDPATPFFTHTVERMADFVGL